MKPRNVLSQYTNADAVLVTVYKARKPRASERTWPASKGSKWNLGTKGANLRDAGLSHAKG